MLRIVILILIFVYLSAYSYADNINLSHLTVKDGLSNSTVYFAMQDSKGFIWFCTETGVSRYDGKKFENFTISDGLADNEIFKCFEDSKHRIWFLSYNGKLSFYQNGKIFNSDNAPFLSYRLTGAFLLQCAEDKWNNVWFSTSFGNVIKVNSDHVTQYEPLYFDRNHSDYYISSVLFQENDSMKKFFVDPSNRNLYTQNLASGETRNIGKFPDICQDKDKKVTKGFCNEASTLFINGPDFISYNGHEQWHTLDFKKYGITSNALSFLQDGHYLWLATDGNGVFKIDQETGELSQNLLQGELVTKIIKDNEDNLWFVTHDNGVFVLKNNSQYFTTINTETTFSTGILEYNSKKYILSGNNNGVVYAISDGQILNSFQLSERKFNRVLDIIPVGGGRVIIGCDGGLYEYDVVKHIKMDRSNYLQGYKNYQIAPDSSIWFCSQDRILKLKDNKYYPVSNKLGIVKYTAIAIVSDSIYYVGTTNKLYKVTQYGQQFEVVLDDHILKTQVAGMKFINGFLWVATHGNGIFIIKNDKIIRHISKANYGIVSDICQKLYDDRGKYVWITTNEGVSVIGRNDFKLVCIINADVGIASNDIKSISTSGETVSAATAGGTSIFKLADVKLQSKPPAVYITSYKKGNDILIDPPGHIEFNYFKGFITISFTAITFQSAHNLQYEYKYAGESGWHRTPVTDIPFFSLSPGSHDILFRAKKYNSDWSQPVLLSIAVNPLWYQAGWFQIALCLLLLFVAYYIVRTRLQTIRKKVNEENEYNRKIKELESKALISQMNPHFIFNSLNTVQQLILVKEEQQSLDFLSDFSMLMRKMLENSRKQLITLSEELDFLKRYLQLEAVRFNNKFEYRIAIDQNIFPDEIKIPPVLIQPLLENAIKHGISSLKANGLIQLTVCKENDFLIAVVEDNGIGIHTHRLEVLAFGQKKESTALIVLEERLKLLKIDKNERPLIKIVDKGHLANKVTGTLIEIRIPIRT